jgi:hypothetical protein
MKEPDIDTDSTMDVFFKDDYDEPILHKIMPLTTTFREIRQANPFGMDKLWIDFAPFATGRLERIELFSTTERRKAELSYDMALDDIYSFCGGSESWNQIASTLEAVIWNWSERIKTALGTDSFAVNWGAPGSDYVHADGSVLYFLDSEIGYLRFQREYKSREDLDTITLCELRNRAGVLCDHLEKILEEVSSSPALEDNRKRLRWGYD